MKTLFLVLAGGFFAGSFAQGITVRHSSLANGDDADADSFAAAATPDGRYIAFESIASNLGASDTNEAWDIFVRDTQTGSITRVSVGDGGVQSNGDSWYPSISAEGRYVAFSSRANNVVAGDTNGSWDVFVHDRVLSTTSIVSVADGGGATDGDSLDPTISSDGRYVAFDSTASNIVTGDTNNSIDVFVRDLQINASTRVSVGAGGVQGNSDSGYACISGNSRYIVFSSTATNLVAGDTNSVRDIFRFDTQTLTTSRISVGAGGVQANVASFDPVINADGRYIAFESLATNLIAGDTNGFADVFVRDTQAGATTRVGNTQGNGDSYFAAISGDGRYVAFVSEASNLVGGDTNVVADVFVFDRVAPATNIVSIATSGGFGSLWSSMPFLGGSGVFVGFVSLSPEFATLDLNDAIDVFVATQIQALLR